MLPSLIIGMQPMPMAETARPSPSVRLFMGMAGSPELGRQATVVLWLPMRNARAFLSIRHERQ
jgi:hypothetical protein